MKNYQGRAFEPKITWEWILRFSDENGDCYDISQYEVGTIDLLGLLSKQWDLEPGHTFELCLGRIIGDKANKLDVDELAPYRRCEYTIDWATRTCEPTDVDNARLPRALHSIPPTILAEIKNVRRTF